VLSNGSGVAEEPKNDAGNRTFKYHILTLVLFRAHSSDQAVIPLVKQTVSIHQERDLVRVALEKIHLGKSLNFSIAETQHLRQSSCDTAGA